MSEAEIIGTDEAVEAFIAEAETIPAGTPLFASTEESV